MKLQIKKYIVITVLFVSIIFTSILPMGMVKAIGNQKIELKADKTQVNPGDIVVVSVETTKDLEMAAFDIRIDADMEIFSIVKVGVGKNTENIYFGKQNNTIYLNWVSNKNVKIDAGTILAVSLRVNNEAEWKSYQIALNKIDIFDVSENKIATVLDDSSKVEITVGKTKSDLVLNAEKLISDIGKVEGTVECLDKITAALEAFHAIKPVSDKTLVKNYKELQAAINKYNLLREKEAADVVESDVKNEVTEFQAKHKKVLSLTEKTVSIKDGTAVKAALIDYAAKDPYIRKKLQAEYKKLLLLSDKISKLQDELDEKELAKLQIAQFFEYYGSLLKYTVETIPASDLQLIKDSKAALESAMATYDSYNEIAKKELIKEYKHLTELNDYIVEQEVQNAEDPEWVIRGYNAFLTKYASLLSKTEGEVTSKDAPIIGKAISELKSLKPQVKGKLLAQYDHLMNLMNAINQVGLEDTQVGTDDTNESDNQSNNQSGIQTIITEIEKFVEVEKLVSAEVDENGEKTVRVLGVDFSPSIWFGIVIFIMMFTSMVLYVMPFIVYIILMRRKERVNQDENI